jgi:hypothetical protein
MVAWYYFFNSVLTLTDGQVKAIYAPGRPYDSFTLQMPRGYIPLTTSSPDSAYRTYYNVYYMYVHVHRCF